MIRLEKVSKSFGAGADAVSEIDLEVEAQSLLVLLGESGSGKTTTLKMINRLVEPTAGVICVDGTDVRERDPVELRRTMGYVFQGIGLFPHLSVAGNIATVPRLLRWSAKEIDARVNELLELVGLPAGDYAERFPRELSGGQAQRVGVARALAARPGILLMDEPFGALDPLTREELQTELSSLQRRLGLTIVLVTHDVNEALLLADRIAVMKDGRIAGAGTPGELLAGRAENYVSRLISMPVRQARRIRTARHD